MTKGTALDAAELATIRATRYLHEAASGQREGDADVACNLADAREEIEKARWFLARAVAAGRWEPLANFWVRSDRTLFWHPSEGFHSESAKFSQWLRSNRARGEINVVAGL